MVGQNWPSKFHGQQLVQNFHTVRFVALLNQKHPKAVWKKHLNSD